MSEKVRKLSKYSTGASAKFLSKIILLHDKVVCYL